ncbi:putative OPT oligopeptide transporter [Colletotrichum sublineola]|uniref:Putative OPT oligopeptide transporter n=1 Tax=Colletotrichum sublineola TaxID=1173701 RepID=A0A066XYS5_COLSU|nr:putative OPT oligopeptide transporter [Colletotrichum sublineola]
MASEKHDAPTSPIEVGRTQGVLTDEKLADAHAHELDRLDSEEQVFESHLQVTEDDLIEAKAIAATLSLDGVRKMMETVLRIHDRDPNFPHVTLMKIHEFLDNENVFENPEKHEQLIWEMKLEAALITNNSPYAEVRAVVDNKDDPNLPCGTIRAWTIGVFFSVFLAFVNQLFSIRQPSISIESNVAQLLAYPLGKAWEKTMPNIDIKLFGYNLPLNPGPFNKKEHMLIAIMANTAKSLPYTQYIVWTQVLPQYFNQPYAKSFGYQILIGLSTNFIGYGLAGLTRRFIVYPSFCVWPASLVTIALNSALHNENNVPVPGPFKKLYSMTRYKFFLWSFGAMFVYFWFPNYIFEVLTFFSWMTWISPNNHNLEILTGFKNGLGMFNFWPTFDWNVMLFDAVDPLMVPAFSTFNRTLGMWLIGFIIMGIYYTNAWNTAYLPINSNRVFDHFGKIYNVSRAIDDRGMYDHEKYMDYSAAYLGAANTLVYGAFFAMYAAAITHVAIFHRYEIMMGFKNIYVTCAHAVSFANDLKVAHYLKMPPRQTFACQMVATLISTFVCTGVMNFQINIPNICTTNAPMRFFCPGPNTCICLPVAFYFLIKYSPKNRYLRQFHPVALFYGGVNWAPYSFSYAWPAVPIAWLSWIYVRNRYLAFWSKYNFVLSASFSAGIAIAGILMLFTVQWLGADIDWWGNAQASAGCEGTACTLKTLAKGERFYPWWNPSQVPAP